MIKFLSQKFQLFVILNLLIVSFWNTFESKVCSKPGSSYCACRVAITSMQNASQTELFPRTLGSKKSIVCYDCTINSESSRPFSPCVRSVKMLSLNNSIFLWERGSVFLLWILGNISLFGIFLPALYEFVPLTAF